MKPHASFWNEMMELARTNFIMDRPKGSAHPRYAKVTYPLGYGYLENTSSSNGGGIDI